MAFTSNDPGTKGEGGGARKSGPPENWRHRDQTCATVGTACSPGRAALRRGGPVKRRAIATAHRTAALGRSVSDCIAVTSGNRFGTTPLSGRGLANRGRNLPMKTTTLLVAAMALALSAPAAIAGSKGGGGASSYAPGSGGGGVGARNSAPGQQMLNRRTSATAPGNSYNAPGQKMIRQRTPGGTPTR